MIPHIIIFLTQFKATHLQYPHSQRPHIWRPCCTLTKCKGQPKIIRLYQQPYQTTIFSPALCLVVSLEVGLISTTETGKSMRPSLERKHRLTLRFRPKLLYLSCAVSNSYETEFEMWLLLGLAGSTQNSCNFVKYSTFFQIFMGKKNTKLELLYTVAST